MLETAGKEELQLVSGGLECGMAGRGWGAQVEVREGVSCQCSSGEAPFPRELFELWVYYWWQELRSFGVVKFRLTEHLFLMQSKTFCQGRFSPRKMSSESSRNSYRRRERRFRRKPCT